MKRDMDLLRSILLLAEAQPAGEPLSDFKSLGEDPKVIAEHVWLADQGGLVDARFAGGSPASGMAIVMRLTPAGHDFIAQAQKPALWTKAKEEASKAGVGVTVEVMKALLTSLAMGALGIKP